MSNHRAYNWTAIYLRHPNSPFVLRVLALAARRLQW